jgi:hypothetical protein
VEIHISYSVRNRVFTDAGLTQLPYTQNMTLDPASEKTLVGVLGTVGAWHRWAPRYSLCHLESLVRGLVPDLLCVEICRADWEAGNLATLPFEYRHCLAPLCRQLGIIIVSVGNAWRGPPSPLRLALALGAGPHWFNSQAADRWHQAWARLSSCPPKQTKKW